MNDNFSLLKRVNAKTIEVILMIVVIERQLIKYYGANYKNQLFISCQWKRTTVSLSLPVIGFEETGACILGAKGHLNQTFH
jgi:hypothetical protein